MKNKSLQLPYINQNSSIYDSNYLFSEENASKPNDNDKFRNFIENLPVLFYAVNVTPPFTPLYVSPAFTRFGIDLDTWLNDPEIWLKVIHPEDHEWVFQQTVDSSISGEEVDYEYRILNANGKLHWVRDRGCLIRNEQGDVVYREGVMLDITDRKIAEQALINSEQRYKNLFENANDIIYVHDLEGNYLDINQAGERIFGYSRNEVLSMNMTQVVASDQLKLIRDQLNQKIAFGKKQTVYELDCVKKDGTRITLEINSTAISDEDQPGTIQGIARDITARKVAEEAVKESEQKYRDLFENANDLIYTHDLGGNFTTLNRAGELITGYTREEVSKMNFTQVVAPESMELAHHMVASKLQEDDLSRYELDIIAKDGRRVTLELSTRIIKNGNKLVGVQGIGRDITERRRTEEQLRLSERRFRQLGEGIFHQVWTADITGNLDYVNNRTLEYFSVEAEELLENNWVEYVHPEDRENSISIWENSIKTGSFYETEFRLRRYDGIYRWHKVRGIAGHDSNGDIIKWYGTNTDIDDQKQTEEKLNHIATHDILTGLPNRAEFMNHLQKAVKIKNEFPAATFAVLFLDLDRFKVINDSLGHIVGDKLLRAISERLNSIVRPADIVARLGGDEFTILLNRTGTLENVVSIAERVQQCLTRSFPIDGYEIFVSASIGITISDSLVRQPEDYLRDADSAMYRAKETGKARYEIFNREMHTRNLNQLRIETDLRHAAEREEFTLFYQPIVNLDDGSVNEFEALVRWNHPEFGLLTPDQFIPQAEDCGTIIDIGRFVLKNACRQIAEWQSWAEKSISVSVNLSAKQLMHPSLIGEIRQLLDEYKLKPGQLLLEVTESTVMEHSEHSLAILEELHSMGIPLSTDDFGTGYSSLSYLKEFPFDRLKIDRTFIDKMEDDRVNKAIVKAILMLGENIDLDVVAEGVEDHRHLSSLKELNCKLGQGFLFSRPVAKEEAVKFITHGVSINSMIAEETSIKTNEMALSVVH